MGRTLLILLVGFAASFGVLATSNNRRLIDSVDRMVDQFSAYKSKNAATSGAYLALNQLFQDKTWRTGYNNLVINGDTLNVTVTDNSTDTSVALYRVKINSIGRNDAANNSSQVMLFDRKFQEFAVWAKDTVINVTTQDSVPSNNPNMLIQNAPFMPKIDNDALFDEAFTQGQLQNEDMNNHYHPDDGYPNGSFYHDSTSASQTANVTYVYGNLHIRDNRTVYGIYIVEGDVLLGASAKVRGVLYLPNASSRVYNRTSANSQVLGGIVTWGEIDGEGYQIFVRHKPQFMRALALNYAPNNPPIRVLTWK